MATLDISIIIFALMISLILILLGMGVPNRIFYALAMIYGIVTLGYFIANYSVVSVGTIFTIPFEIFISAWVFLPILVPFILIVRGR